MRMHSMGRIYMANAKKHHAYMCSFLKRDNAKVYPLNIAVSAMLRTLRIAMLA